MMLRGMLGYYEDLVNGVTYRYFEDVAGRNSEMRDSKDNTTEWLFDENGNTTNLKENLSGVNRSTEYSYDKDNKLTRVSYNNNNSKILYSYKGPTSNPENLDRLTDVTVHVDGENKYKTKYSYIDGTNGANSTTGIVSSVALSKIIKVTNPLTNVIEEQEDEQKLLSYTYDDSGNIETITHPDGKVIKHYYDELNQLIREDNQIINKTIDYTYDVGGNIQTKVESDYTADEERTNSREYRYEYDTAWKDKLISYDGKAFEYDAIGNIINDSEYAYTWEQGRRLASMEKSGQNITFKYNAQGIRTEKTVNGITTQYHLVGDKVTYETDGTDTIYYTHDSAGNLVSMNFNGIEYYYVYNAQNDIIALIDAAGNEVVSYTYDTWGKLLSIEGTLKDTIGIKNPYRYRSYRYDTETGLYYLQSRYYNPEVGRMLNADALGGEVGKLLSHNVFTYARNNPINMEDPEGNIAWWIIGAGVGAVVGGISGAIYSYRTKGSVDWRYVAGGAVAGGLIGAGFGYAAKQLFQQSLLQQQPLRQL
jgi:RHS repeat-associated protein